MSNGRIRHATETFVNNLIDSVKKLITANTNQINVLSGSKVDKMTFQRDINIDTFYKEGSHRIFNATGKLPSDITQGENDIVLTCYPLSDGTSFIRKTLLNIRSNKMYLYSKRSDIAYDWEEIATTTKTDISYTLTGGLTHRDTAFSKGWYTNTTASFTIFWSVNGVDIRDWNLVFCTLPPELRPNQQMNDVCIATSLGLITLTIYPDGRITRGNIVQGGIPEWISGSIVGYIRG